MLGTNHFDRATVLIEMIERMFVHSSHFDQRGINDERIMGRRDEKAVEVRTNGTMISSSGEGVRIMGGGYAAKRQRHFWQGWFAERQELVIEKREALGGGAGPLR